MTAQTASIGLQQPPKGPLDAVSGAHNSEIDRLAVRTSCREHSQGSAHDHRDSPFTRSSAAGLACARAGGVAYGSRRVSRRVATLRLTARAALTCSGVRTSGSDTLTRCRARETWRLCRFSSLLFMMSYSPDSSGIVQIRASVVSMREAMEAAFCRAVRVTLVGSITPAFTRSSYCSVSALKP